MKKVRKFFTALGVAAIVSGISFQAFVVPTRAMDFGNQYGDKDVDLEKLYEEAYGDKKDNKLKEEIQNLKIEAARATMKDRMDLAQALAQLALELEKNPQDAEAVTEWRAKVELLRDHYANEPAKDSEDKYKDKFEDELLNGDLRREIESLKIEAARATMKDRMDLAQALAQLAIELGKTPQNKEAVTEWRAKVELLRDHYANKTDKDFEKEYQDEFEKHFSTSIPTEYPTADTKPVGEVPTEKVTETTTEETTESTDVITKSTEEETSSTEVVAPSKSGDKGKTLPQTGEATPIAIMFSLAGLAVLATLLRKKISDNF